MIDNPKSVSVVVCTYNGERFIRQQMDSIIHQTYPISEIIVQDDNSSDGTVAVLKEYEKMDPRVHVYVNRPALGINNNFFSGIRKAKGEFIALSDQDDIWELTKIEQQMNAIGNNLLCSGISKPFSDDGSFVAFDNRPCNISLIRILFVPVPGHTMLFHRDLFFKLMPEKNLIYEKRLYDLTFSIAGAAFDSLVYIEKVLVHQRRYSGAATYTDKSHSVPTIGNALYQLRWVFKNYKQARQRAIARWVPELVFLKALNAKTEVSKEAIRILELEIKDGPIAFLQLQWHFVKNFYRLFQTPGGSFVKLVRAFLYPVMQYFLFRF
ncbi:MAG: glycosyltransferase [Prevotella sp.]|jgi:glycosyltransferase involved in cell wall biosynthesis